MRGRRQADDQQRGVRIAERRNGLAPIIPIEVRAALLLSDAPAILDQARAALALHNFVR